MILPKSLFLHKKILCRKAAIAKLQNEILWHELKMIMRDIKNTRISQNVVFFGVFKISGLDRKPNNSMQSSETVFLPHHHITPRYFEIATSGFVA